MTLPDYQIVVNLFTTISLITFPIAFVMLIIEHITNALLSIMFGKEVKL